MKSKIEVEEACHKWIKQYTITYYAVTHQLTTQPSSVAMEYRTTATPLAAVAAAATVENGGKIKKKKKKKKAGKIACETHFYDPHGHFRFLRFAHLFLPRRERVSRFTFST